MSLQHPSKLAHLVTVTPEEVLGADVLVGELGLLLLRGLVGLVLPVLEPETVGVDTGDDDGGNDDAVEEDNNQICVQLSSRFLLPSIFLSFFLLF